MVKKQKDKKPYRKKELFLPFESALTLKYGRLEQKNPVNYDSAELCFAVRQHMFLEQTVPLAIDILRGHPLAEGEYSPGDLLETLLTKVSENYWSQNRAEQRQMTEIVADLKPNDIAELPSTALQAIARWTGQANLS